MVFCSVRSAFFCCFLNTVLAGLHERGHNAPVGPFASRKSTDELAVCHFT